MKTIRLKHYIDLMTKLLDKALEAIRALPPETQDNIARAILALAGEDEEPEAIDPAHLPAVLEALQQANRRNFANDADIEVTFRRFDAQ